MNFTRRVRNYRIYPWHKYAFWSSMVFGCITNLYMFTNKLSYHDDISLLFSVGSTWSSGRWFLGILGAFIDKLYGNYSLPVTEGILSIFFISLSAAILTDIFEIHSKSGCILAGAIMAVFPTVFSTFMYMFTAPYYFFSLFMVAIAVFCIKTNDSIVSWCIGGILIGCATGIYQAYFPVAVSSLLGLVILETISNKSSSLQVIKKGFWYLGILIFSLIFYFSMTKLFCYLMNAPLTDYKGINNMGRIPWRQMPFLILKAYQEGFRLLVEINGISCSAFANVLYRVFAIAFSIMAVFFSWLCFKNKKTKGLLLILEFLLFPISVNLIYIMCPSGWIAVIMRYGLVVSFLLFIALLEQTTKNIINLDGFLRICLGSCRWGGMCVLAGIISIYVQYANVEYLRFGFLQSQAQSYFTTLISQIKSVPNYQADMPIVFIGEHSTINFDTSFAEERYFSGYFPRKLGDLLNDYVWEIYMMRWCGFSPEIEEEAPYIQLPEVQEMNSYPNDNSIKVLNNVVIVKLSE